MEPPASPPTTGSEREVDTDVLVVGGGPAGMMLGLLLARQGVRVTVLEKHGDFLRDFRGDTVHPSTLDVLDELGLGGALEEVPHRDVSVLRVTFADGTFTVADFERLDVAHPYIRFVPQWDLLNILAESASALPNFELLRNHEVIDVLRGVDGEVAGVRAVTPRGQTEVRARLTVAADGRDSATVQAAGLSRRSFGAPMDALWFRLTRDGDRAAGLDMHVRPGRIVLGIDRGEYWQVAYVIAKGEEDAIREGGLDRFRRSVAQASPVLADQVHELRSWDDIRTLRVRVERLRRWWSPGLLVIGDAAHPMSPIGGVGINLAVQDAVCAARVLAEPLRVGMVGASTLRAVQARRTFPTVATQLLQRTAQRLLVEPALAATEPIDSPMALRVLRRIPALQAVPARVVGLGFRPERVAG